MLSIINIDIPWFRLVMYTVLNSWYLLKQIPVVSTSPSVEVNYNKQAYFIIFIIEAGLTLGVGCHLAVDSQYWLDETIFIQLNIIHSHLPHFSNNLVHKIALK